MQHPSDILFNYNHTKQPGNFIFGVKYHDMHIINHAKTHINGTSHLAISI